MSVEVTTEDYIFFTEGTELFVKFVHHPDAHSVKLTGVNTKIVGIMYDDKNEKPWTLAIISKESIQKLQLQVSESLEIVGFHFKEKNTALTTQNLFLTYFYPESRKIK